MDEAHEQNVPTPWETLQSIATKFHKPSENNQLQSTMFPFCYLFFTSVCREAKCSRVESPVSWDFPTLRRMVHVIQVF